MEAYEVKIGSLVVVETTHETAMIVSDVLFDDNGRPEEHPENNGKSHRVALMILNGDGTPQDTVDYPARMDYGLQLLPLRILETRPVGEQ